MLFGSTILEVAIGMAFVYVLLSLICSAVNEWIAGIVHLRAKFLKKGIANLLDDPVMKGLAEQFYQHPLVKGSAQDKKTPQPSYVSAQTFARVLIDLVPKSGDNNKPQSLLETYQAARATLTDLTAKKSELAKTLLLLLDEAGVDPAKAKKVSETLKTLDEARNKLLPADSNANTPSPELARALLDNIKEMEAKVKQTDAEVTAALQKAQQNIEKHFDEAMDRVTGWYKRRVQIIIVALGLLVTILLNVDSFAIANSLMTNPAQRTLIADMAAASTITSTATITPTVDPLKQLQGLGLPMGWKKSVAEGKTDANGQEWIWKGWKPWDWSVKVVGLLITAAAISQGAPFWFDLLSKLLNLRMTGKKPEQTPKQE